MGRDKEKQKQYLRQYNLRYRERDRESRREANYRHHIKLRMTALHVLGDRCVRCGNDDQRVLQVDHVYGGGTKEHNRIGWRNIMVKIRDGHVDGYQLLCANCNVIKRTELRENGRGVRRKLGAQPREVLARLREGREVHG